MNLPFSVTITDPQRDLQSAQNPGVRVTDIETPDEHTVARSVGEFRWQNPVADSWQLRMIRASAGFCPDRPVRYSVSTLIGRQPLRMSRTRQLSNAQDSVSPPGNSGSSILGSFEQH
ncbi:hypothetical protein [Paraburkholderia sp. BCC1886]|uniref:hypothetical protein n=1 Tax=Paraburkholderia sp. BCC1886 TaxID=2562670 RepID=UPI00164275E6|nr:hypothetical protein [Paraburkholderia sp. BCC1886]